MNKITPFLWFDDQVEEAMRFYTSIFKNSRLENVSRYGNEAPDKKGKVMTASFSLGGREFMALNGGPVFHFTPAISFFVFCKTQKEVDDLWEKLSEGGTVLMELGKYPFSERFGWVNDKYGVSWQVNLANVKQKITPFLMFVGKQQGKAREAINYYTSVFKNSSISNLVAYGKGAGEPEGTISHAVFSLEGQDYMAMDSSMEHNFTFNEATSLFVNCKTQAEVDDLWEKLSDGGEKGQCGWLKDKYGVSWQIVPTTLGVLLSDKDAEKSGRVMQAMLKMKKLDIAGLERAYAGD